MAAPSCQGIESRGELTLHFIQDIEEKENLQGPHDWRKRLRPVQSPIKSENPSFTPEDGDGKSKDDKGEKPKSRPMPPWKKDLIEKNKRVARLVRRESSGRTDTGLIRRESSGRSNSGVVRRESSGRSKRIATETSGIPRKKSFNRGPESPFTQQVVNENSGQVNHMGRKRVSPANSFSQSNVKRVPSDKANDPGSQLTMKRIERVQKARLYLLQQMGPNSFLIGGDSPDHKFRVIIGPQTCSCAKGPHCVHVLFVMLRVFQVRDNDPVLWSKTLKNFEVESLFRAYNEKRTSRIQNTKDEKVRKSSRPAREIADSSSPEQSVTPVESDAGSVREEDETCPICLLEMVEGESLLKCENGCQNRLHHHCIAIWFEECRRQNEPLICPLCRAHWKTASVEVKSNEASPPEQPLVPPNTRAPSPQLDQDIHTPGRLPYAEPIPQEHAQLAAPWIENFGEDLVACLFSRNWSIRETGLKHLGREVLAVMLQSSGDGRSGIVLSPNRQSDPYKILGCFFSVLAFMVSDPVYKVFIAGLKSLRTVLSHISGREEQQRARLRVLIKPVVDAIIIKCTDGNRRTNQLSLSTMAELAKGQHGELAVGRELVNPGTRGLGGMSYILPILIEDYTPSEISWQWLLGRLYVIDKFFEEFSSEFIPRLNPDGASSENSMETVGASAEDSLPAGCERLLSIAQFAIRGINNSHARISRMSRRVFLLVTRFSTHVEKLLTELYNMLNQLDTSHMQSMQRKFARIVEDFNLSEKIVDELHHGIVCKNDLTPDDTPMDSPTSSPRCNSPLTVTSISDSQSEGGCVTIPKTPFLVPPNTPIRARRIDAEQNSAGHKVEHNSDEESPSGTVETRTVKLIRVAKVFSPSELKFQDSTSHQLVVSDSSITMPKDVNSPKFTDCSVSPLKGADYTLSTTEVINMDSSVSTPKVCDLLSVKSSQEGSNSSRSHSKVTDLSKSHVKVAESSKSLHKIVNDSASSSASSDAALVIDSSAVAPMVTDSPLTPSRVTNENLVVTSPENMDSIDSPSKVKMRKWRSKTPPKPIGPVLETNLDDVILLQESQTVARKNTESIPCGQSLKSEPESPRHQNKTLSPSRSEDNLLVDMSMSLTSSDNHSISDMDNVSEETTDNQKTTLYEIVQKSMEDLTEMDKINRIKLKRTFSPLVGDIDIDWDKKQNFDSDCNAIYSKNECATKHACSRNLKCSSQCSAAGSCSGDLSNGKQNRFPTANQKSLLSEELLEISPTVHGAAIEKPVTFQSEVTAATPKNSPGQTLARAGEEEEECSCKEEVEREEALALARAMEVSVADPPKPVVPGLTPTEKEEVVTIRIQPDNECEIMDNNGNQPTLYLENTHWVKGPLLGTGAYSTCYQARDAKTGIIMAVKQISFCRNSSTEQENVIETITEEIHMMAKLNHPNIVRIMGATKQGCHFNMFVEWMPGGSVAYLLSQYGPFMENVIANYVLQILRGLAYLHDNHILHRDLKGANLLVDSTGQRLRIGDFGAAARLASQATGAGEFQGQLLGTIAFMAPEVLRGEDYGRACDVWSVGCCLVEMCTTKPPWNAHDISNHLALIFKIATSVSSPPIPDNLSPPLRDLMLRCLEHSKEMRPTAKDLLLHPLFTQYMQRKR
ncbi:hypothetical protein CHS0354_006982 [Potamilus streckersoni]|uniref:Mitogen-activated protein kinase kinase kinase 1 n=1 Tax=Potamilus streckersoni TaxID=2493646 RepID=A0AAE0RWR9_9BIVA|nr:hypothetical protein CHS0354_006982 [Potamilus streckersoni]